ncbi:GIY-YIG nuclease family protein [Cohnella caldifontis]|uniref:GIY-YIG nuclease family protein n=1 Tax=Cohnella caldifontis TaxID=3027471 RepID=UPI0023EA9C01|nr:GIY-YIG nuclease family protein [Cohnella sp. YIM B05605]
MTLEKQRKKELADAYARSFRPMGVFQLRNTANGKIYVGAAMDLDGMRNRVFFMGGQTEPFAVLRQDWRQYGPESFAFEILDRLDPKEDSLASQADLAKYKEELDALLELWLEKLQPYGDRGYNKPKRS